MGFRKYAPHQIDYPMFFAILNVIKKGRKRPPPLTREREFCKQMCRLVNGHV